MPNKLALAETQRAEWLLGTFKIQSDNPSNPPFAMIPFAQIKQFVTFNQLKFFSSSD